MSNFISIIASILSFVYFVPYLISIYQGKTKPNRASWWIWGTNGLVLCASYYHTGAGDTLWALFFPVVAQLIIAILSLKYGKGGWNSFDKMCLAGAGMGLLLWWRYNSPFIAIILSLVIDFLGALPTIKKSYQEPETENLLAWLLYGSGSLLNLFTIENWSIEIAAVPLYVFFINVIIVTLLVSPINSKRFATRKILKHRKY